MHMAAVPWLERKLQVIMLMQLFDQLVTPLHPLTSPYIPLHPLTPCR